MSPYKSWHLFCQHISTNEATQQGCFFRSLGAPPSHRIGLCAPFGRSRIRFAFAAKAVGELAHKRRGRDIFAKGEIPGIAHEKNPIHIPPFVRRGELRSPAGVQRTPLRSKKRFYKNFFNILQSVPKCAIINLLIGEGTHNKKQHWQKANHYKGGDTHRKKRNCC